jgi:MFS family permease
MVRGQSTFSGMNALLNTVGSAFSGVMVAFFGVPLIIIINGLSNLYSAISEMFINVPKTAQQGEKVNLGSVLRDTKQAIKVIVSEPLLRIFIPSAILINLLGAGAFSLILPFCMEKGFSVDMYGYLMSIYTASALVCVVLLGIVKLKPKTRFLSMAIGFSAASAIMVIGYLSKSFVAVAICAALGAFLNTAGNTIFSASIMLALPDENRGAILGFFSAASMGGSALSAVVYGVLGDVFPLSTVFAIGSLLSLAPTLFLCFNKQTKSFILSH